MINLDNIEMVLFDFDDTLCIHKEHKGSPKNIEEKHLIKIF